MKKHAFCLAAKTAVMLPNWEWWAWPLAKNFIGGASLEEAEKKALELAQKGYPLIFNYASEHIENFWQASDTRLAYAKLIDWLRNKKISASLSLKFSQFGLTPKDMLQNLKLAEKELFIDILKRARDNNLRAWIDAEHLSDRKHYNYVLPMLWQKGFTNLGRVVQASARAENWEKFVEDCARVPIPTRICKGAYRRDSESLSFETEYPKIVRQFRYAADTLMGRGLEMEIATHDPSLIQAGLLPKNAHLAMLLGINVKRARELQSLSVPPHLYFIFGPNWAPYLKRRILENPEYLLLPFQKNEPY